MQMKIAVVGEAHEGRLVDGPGSVFLIFLKLGLTSFGGPIAHLGYFRREFVVRRCWLTEPQYAQLVALCQLLPGPTSSQVGMALGQARSGSAGALAAWLGFTLPSALLMVAFAYGLADLRSPPAQAALHGLNIVAVAVVAQAIWGMARAICTDALRVAVTAASAWVALAVPGPAAQVAVIVAAGVFGWFALTPRGPAPGEAGSLRTPGRAAGILFGVMFFILLFALPLASHAWPSQGLALADRFYRAGALVFGGGHVVLPLLEAAVVPNGWVSSEAFLAGYGAAQAVPGPLFSFAAFLGAAMNLPPSGSLGAAICLISIFLPSFLLVPCTLAFWHPLSQSRLLQRAVAGANAAVVGLLVAAFYRPVWVSGILTLSDFVIALTALMALQVARLPAWLVVLGCAGGAVLVR